MDTIATLLLAAQPILQTLLAAGGQPQVVGGAVRDALLGYPIQDIDVEVFGLQPEQVQAALLHLGKVEAVGKSFGVIKVRLPGGHDLDVSLPQRRSADASGERGFLGVPDPTMTLQDAAARRDFTMNAMSITPTGELLDFFGGQRDLGARILRHTSPLFGEDPLRVLRAVQFAARFRLQLARETIDLCQQLLPTAAALPVERIWPEWRKWASAGVVPSLGLAALAAIGWLELYPELLALQGCPQSPTHHPEGDVWVHTNLVCDAAAQIALREALPSDERAVLLLAALCHDLGKPATTVIDDDGRIRSPGHAAMGVEPTRQLLARFGCVRTVVAEVVPLVREHMVHNGTYPHSKMLRRLAVRLAPASIERWGQLVEADHSGRPPHPPRNPSVPFVAMAQTLNVNVNPPSPLILGRDLIALGYEPGPSLRPMLDAAYQAQLDGIFDNQADGIDWVKNHKLPLGGS
jgi:tRNA nucleotidyltransferase (CCA-adding enzyme)